MPCALGWLLPHSVLLTPSSLPCRAQTPISLGNPSNQINIPVHSKWLPQVPHLLQGMTTEAVWPQHGQPHSLIYEHSIHASSLQASGSRAFSACIGPLLDPVFF